MSYPISQTIPTRMRYHRSYIKDIDAVFPFTLDWYALIPAGDTITTATSVTRVHGSVDTTTTDITVDSTTYTDRTTTTVLSSGLDNVDYDIRVRVTTTAGWTDDRTILIHCTQR